MRILFMGVGLTDYYNQVLNKLSDQNDLEIINVVANSGSGHAGENVHQTIDGVKFKVVYLKEVRYKIWSDFQYRGFRDFMPTISEINPDIIVSSELYIKWLFKDKKVSALLLQKGIKVIMKDIPFRLKKYDSEIKRISEQDDSDFVPLFFIYMKKVLSRIKLGFISILSKKLYNIKLVKKSLYLLFFKKIELRKVEDKRQILKLPHAHVVYVKDAYDIFMSYGVQKEKIFVIFNSPDTDLMFDIRERLEATSSYSKDGIKRIIHIGRLIPWKNVDMLIEAFHEIKNRFKNSELIIIGTGPEEKRLKDIASSLKLEKSTRFMGGIYDSAEIGRHLLSSTVYVLAGMGGISINDAMIFGKPVVCSVCDGTEKELVINGINGYYFKEGDVTDLTEKITRILSDESLISQMGNASTKIIKEKINIHTVINGYKEAFNFVKHE